MSNKWEYEKEKRCSDPVPIIYADPGDGNIYAIQPKPATGWLKISALLLSVEHCIIMESKEQEHVTCITEVNIEK